ncbi:MAG: dehydrogenase subunit [Vampirovibrio sp.]|jgi:NAD(P)H-quinone oxidoreductase subunit 4L|nr:dehydrogenase subunit [Vampirovibrio sp.]
MPDFITHIGLTHYIVVATVLFVIGLTGVLTSRNVVRVLLAVELMLSAVNINLVAFNNYLHLDTGLLGQVLAIFVLTVSAAEASVGLAIVIALYRSRATADVEDYNLLKW